VDASDQEFVTSRTIAASMPETTSTSFIRVRPATSFQIIRPSATQCRIATTSIPIRQAWSQGSCFMPRHGATPGPRWNQRFSWTFYYLLRKQLTELAADRQQCAGCPSCGACAIFARALLPAMTEAAQTEVTPTRLAPSREGDGASVHRPTEARRAN